MKTGNNTFAAQFQQEVFANKPFQFERKALELFHYQHSNNEIYRDYCNEVNCLPEEVKSLQDIPFLPISFFKTHQVVCGKQEKEVIFSSSGTTGMQASKHIVKDIDVYIQSFVKGFETFYSSFNDYCILGLLPSYLERTGSSLIYMVDYFIKNSKHPDSGFFLNNTDQLFETLERLSSTKEKVLLIGVSFALLDFAKQYQLSENTNLIVMETGGMKGRRKEMIRSELHNQLKSGFKQENIHSEYGMTELLSQAYSVGNGKFNSPSWMQVLIREQDDPFSYAKNGKTGAINVIDLANIFSCAFIQTDDLGRKYNDGSFEVLGRFDSSDVRGCNLLVI